MNPGQYVLFTRSAGAAGHRNEIHSDIPCEVDCQAEVALRRGSRVTLIDGATVTGPDFELSVGGRIAGSLTNAGTGAPLPAVTVIVLRQTAAGAVPAGSALTTSTGAFSVRGLTAGSYYVTTQNQAGYINEIYPDIPCAGTCDFAQALAGAAVTVTEGATTGGINLALARGGVISGMVRDAVTSAPIVFATVEIYDADRRAVASATTDDDGAFATGVGLLTGHYYALVQDAQGYQAEIFGNLHCLGDDCVRKVTAGTSIAVIAGSTTANSDFALDRGGTFSGAVIEQATGLPVSFAQVIIYNAAGRAVAFAFTEETGDYASPGLPDGTYYAVTSFTRSLLEERYNDLPCAAGECTAAEVLGGAPIVANAGFHTFAVDFALAADPGTPGAPLNLRATNDGPAVRLTWLPPFGGGAPLGYVVEAGLAPGTTAISLPAGETGLVVPAVPPGTYYLRVRALNAAGSGPPSEEFVLVVGPGGLVAPAQPTFTASITGRRLIVHWRNLANGGAATEFLLEAGSATGASDIATITLDKPVFMFEPVPDGVYFLRVRARNAAGSSEVSQEQMIVVGGVPSPPGAPAIYEALAEGSTVTIKWDAPSGPVTGYILEAGTARFLSNLATTPLGPATSLTVTGIPAGTYYVRVRAVNARGASVASSPVRIIVP